MQTESEYISVDEIDKAKDNAYVRTIAVDFDGVFHRYYGWQPGPIPATDGPLPGALDGMLELMQHYSVFILSSRKPRHIVHWIYARYGRSRLPCTTRVPHNGLWNRRGVLLVTNRKLPASIYLDDRALKFESWEKALNDIFTLANWKK